MTHLIFLYFIDVEMQLLEKDDDLFLKKRLDKWTCLIYDPRLCSYSCLIYNLTQSTKKVRHPCYILVDAGKLHHKKRYSFRFIDDHNKQVIKLVYTYFALAVH